ncbi:hypothetical protein QFZ49_004329 [Streptomyces turgidiscabies]|uniref:Uncharacterized protein n=1 Tax=Streptomyces turgidiscabies TaxID=85558 RepID=A0ABU0RQX2_9ACTN|nr:hypothetical protein [Streptomyces turgidiscabies]
MRWVTWGRSRAGWNVPYGGKSAVCGEFLQGRSGRVSLGQARGSRHRVHAPGRTTPSIGIDPAPAVVTVRPGRGACTIVPSPTYIAMWLASSK